MTAVMIFDRAGEFAENKDVARSIRQREIMPRVSKGEEITLDFAGVNLGTQSFFHALLSEVIRKQGPDCLDLILFKNCNDNIKSLIGIVVQYSQESIATE